MKNYILLILSILISLNGISQEPILSLGQWNLTSLSGDVNLKARYRIQNYSFANELEKEGRFEGGIFLKSKSFVWHPNFLLLDFNAEYNPGVNKVDYIGPSDFSETKTANKLFFQSTFFNNRPVSLITFMDYSNTFLRRVNLSNSKIISKAWGSTFFARNKILPLTISFKQFEQSIVEQETQNHNTLNLNNLNVLTNKSFSKRDKTTASYSYNQYKNVYNDNITLENNIGLFNITNELYFDDDRKYHVYTRFNHFNQAGTNDYYRFNVNESINLMLPLRFRLRLGYNYNQTSQRTIKNEEHIARTNLQHKLYASLTTNIFYEYRNFKNQTNNSERHRTGFNVQYSKKIPTGRLQLSYSYQLEINNKKTLPLPINIVSEEYTLIDGQILMLLTPYIDINSVVVTDFSGTMIYQRDIDYLLIQRNDYIEIQRLPGGLIANNDIVYVNYTAAQPASSTYNTNNHTVSTNIYLFKNLLELYYRLSYNDYVNVSGAFLPFMKFHTQNITGLRLTYKFIEGGAEYENYISNILPYWATKYYLRANKNMKRMSLSLMANHDSYMMTDDNYQRTFTNISGNFSWRFTSELKIDTEVAYRLQKEPEYKLGYFSAKSKLTAIYRQLHMSVGLEVYYRDYLGYNHGINGAFIELKRKF